MMPVLPVRGQGYHLQVHGNADVYPLSQTAVLASGLTCQPRPVFQSYSAYTPKLAEMNAAHRSLSLLAAGERTPVIYYPRKLAPVFFRPS
jgi:hypothetical protein